VCQNAASVPLAFCFSDRCGASFAWQLQLQRTVDRVSQGLSICIACLHSSLLPSRIASTACVCALSSLYGTSTGRVLRLSRQRPVVELRQHGTQATRLAARRRCLWRVTVVCGRGGGHWTLDEDFSRGHPMMMVSPRSHMRNCLCCVNRLCWVNRLCGVALPAV
jgi:hypothetical protein